MTEEKDKSGHTAPALQPHLMSAATREALITKHLTRLYGIEAVSSVMSAVNAESVAAALGLPSPQPLPSQPAERDDRRQRIPERRFPMTENARLDFQYNPELIQSFSIQKRSDSLLGSIPIWEVYISRQPSRDKYNRGIGDVTAIGRADTFFDAYAQALELLEIKYEARLRERNEIPPGPIPPMKPEPKASALDLLKELGL